MNEIETTTTDKNIIADEAASTTTAAPAATAPDGEASGGQVKAISYVMIITLVGKLLGLWRDRLLAVNYGMDTEASAFLVASRIPRVFFDILFASAISVSFIPVFTSVMKKDGRDRALAFSGNFITVVGLATILISGAGIVFAEPLVKLFAGGFDAETMALCVNLTRIMFPTAFFTGIAFAFVGILQSFDEFNIPAFISVLSNVVIIAYYLTLNNRFGIYGLAIAFLIGWSVQALVQIPTLKKKGFRYIPSLRVRNEEMKQVMTLMLPVMVSTWVQPINLTVNSRFASELYNGNGVSAMEYGNNLYLVIIGVFVLSITNVIFPRLSRLHASEDGEKAFRETVNVTMHASLFFVLPMMFGLVALSKELTDLIYGGGQLDAEGVGLTAMVLAIVSFGMVGYAMQNILNRVYFSQMDGKTPLIAGAVSIAVNIGLCFLLIGPMGLAGLALASAISATVNAIALDIPLELKGQGFISRAFCIDMLKTLLASAVMFAVVRACAAGIGAVTSGGAGKLLVLALPTGAGVIVFFIITAAFGLEEAGIAVGIIKKVMGKIFSRSKG